MWEGVGRRVGVGGCGRVWDGEWGGRVWDGEWVWEGVGWRVSVGGCGTESECGRVWDGEWGGRVWEGVGRRVGWEGVGWRVGVGGCGTESGCGWVSGCGRVSGGGVSGECGMWVGVGRMIDVVSVYNHHPYLPPCSTCDLSQRYREEGELVWDKVGTGRRESWCGTRWVYTNCCCMMAQKEYSISAYSKYKNG